METKRAGGHKIWEKKKLEGIFTSKLFYWVDCIYNEGRSLGDVKSYVTSGLLGH